MSRGRIGLLLAIMIFTAGAVWAVPPGKTLEFNNSPMGTVYFDGKVHQEAEMKCADCHNQDVFPKMMQGTVEITMAEIYAGRLCGICHNGGRAFDAKGNCTRCHVKK